MNTSYNEIVNIPSIGEKENPISLNDILTKANNEHLTPAKNNAERVMFLGIDVQQSFMENGSHADLASARQAIANLNREEITTAFISFGSDAQHEANKLGFKNLLTVGSSASELRRAFDCLSKSVIESSKSVVADEDDFFV